MFSVEDQLYRDYAESAKMISRAKVSAMLSDSNVQGLDKVEDTDIFAMTTEQLSQKYPLYATSLLNLIQLSEKNIKK